jgi:hypothetical protein
MVKGGKLVRATKKKRRSKRTKQNKTKIKIIN